MIYTSNDEINSYNLKKLLQKIVEDCKPEVKIVVPYGIHGFKDGRLGHHDNGLVRCFKLAIEHVHEMEIVKEKKISIKGIILDTSSSKSIKNHKEMIKSKQKINLKEYLSF